MRKIEESVKSQDTVITLMLTTDDGLTYSEEVVVSNNHKEFETNLKTARSKIYAKRVWLNARKALTLDEIKQLDSAN